MEETEEYHYSCQQEVLGSTGSSYVDHLRLRGGLVANDYHILCEWIKAMEWTAGQGTSLKSVQVQPNRRNE